MVFLNSAFVVLICFLLAMPLKKGEYSEVTYLKILQFSLFPLFVAIIAFDFKRFFIEDGPYAYFADEIIIANIDLIVPSFLFGAIFRIYIELTQSHR